MTRSSAGTSRVKWAQGSPPLQGGCGAEWERAPPSRRHLEISDSFLPLLWGKDWLNESGQKCLDGEDLIGHTWKGG